MRAWDTHTHLLMPYRHPRVGVRHCRRPRRRTTTEPAPSCSTACTTTRSLSSDATTANTHRHAHQRRVTYTQQQGARKASDTTHKQPRRVTTPSRCCHRCACAALELRTGRGSAKPQRCSPCTCALPYQIHNRGGQLRGTKPAVLAGRHESQQMQPLQDSAQRGDAVLRTTCREYSLLSDVDGMSL